MKVGVDQSPKRIYIWYNNNMIRLTSVEGKQLVEALSKAVDHIVNPHTFQEINIKIQ